ncbi:ABC transporter transmembrane domain-containing protein [Massilia sp. TSP1-1-2]|uniref:ABC transporter transmembrane domain-containing protein n=1 Tax=unclassified Massilia TaxID=2609279 RepID=UPI003CE8A716
MFESLFKLPPLYSQHRPTGVIAARLHGVETIREFIASAAVTLILDFPFLLIFVAIMFYYSVTLTLIVLAILSVIVILSLIVAPMFHGAPAGTVHDGRAQPGFSHRIHGRAGNG